MSDDQVKKLTKEEAEELAFQQELKAIQLEEAKIRLEVAKAQAQEFREKEENKKRVSAIRVEAVKREQEENERRQKVCKHKTGGKGKAGFVNGDGTHGYTVLPCVLPTGELYLTCTRCQREWHHPAWTVKMEVFSSYNKKTSMTKERYQKQLKEYEEALQWDHEYTEMMEASLFRIPALDQINVPKIMEAQPVR